MAETSEEKKQVSEPGPLNGPCRFSLLRLLVAAGLPAALLAGAAILYFYDPARGPRLLPCFIYQLTGLNCVGCGATRALHALLHGDLVAAASYNLFFVVWLPFLAWTFLAEWLRAVAGRPVLQHIRGWRWLLITLLASALSFLVLRNLPWAPFNWLAA
jgi:hypothetical protein